jgi:hypothetical protein
MWEYVVACEFLDEEHPKIPTGSPQDRISIEAEQDHPEPQSPAATTDDHPDLAAMLSNLGNMLGSRFKQTDRLEDLEEAIRRAEQAVAMCG